MVPIRSRWHDGGISEVPPGAPARQAGLVFALCGLRLQAEGISPGPIEATVTITDKNGHLAGQLDMDARDAQWMADAVSAMLRHDYGPWRSEDADRLLAGYGPGKRITDSPAAVCSKIPHVEVNSADRNSAGRCDPAKAAHTPRPAPGPTPPGGCGWRSCPR